MSLLERQTESTILNAALDRATVGSGAVVLVSGEAGIGKTALIDDWPVVTPMKYIVGRVAGASEGGINEAEMARHFGRRRPRRQTSTAGKYPDGYLRHLRA